MPTATRTQKNLNDTAEQVIKLNERFTDVGKRVGNVCLDSYDSLVQEVTSFQPKLAGRSENDGVNSAVAAHVALTRALTSAYTSAARELIA